MNLLGLRWTRPLFLVFVCMFSVAGVFATCTPEPDTILISSGTDLLGEFQSGDEVYIHQNISENPLDIALRFSNGTCISSTNQFSFRLVPSGSTVTADDLVNVTTDGENVTEARFNFALDFVAEDPFRSTFSVTTDSGASQGGSINFRPDGIAPQLASTSFTPSSRYIKAGENISVDYIINDAGSALRSLSVRGGQADTHNVQFEGRNETYDHTFTTEMQSSGPITFVASDKLGNQFREEINVTVDSGPPALETVDLTYDYTGQQVVTIRAQFKDASFEEFSTIPEVQANLSGISSTMSSVAGNCYDEYNETIECRWEKIPIGLDETGSVQLGFTMVDQAGFEMNATQQVQIQVDRQGPTIQDFYFENELGVKNMLSSRNEGRVVLRVSDESVERGLRAPRIVTDFGPIPFTSRDCAVLDAGLNCTWEMTQELELFEEMHGHNITFRVEVTDAFTNSNRENITVEVDNRRPEIEDIEIRETESIEDGVLKSGEVIDFEVFISDDNLLSNGRYFVTGNLSTIDFSQGSGEVEGECTTYDENTTRCSFRGIELENGYMKRNVTFSVADAAGNERRENKTVEILKVGDEVVSSYTINDLTILNPINRDLILKNSVEGWFEGRIESRDPNMEIINYQLQSCNESQLNPLLVVQYGLFPEEVIINDGQSDLKEFAMNVELKNQPNVEDLSSTSMTCYMSVLKRDDTKIYPSEEVPFKLKFGFYDMPRGDLVEANAQKLLEMTNEINYLGGWFDSIVSIYDVLYGVCSAMSSATGIMSGISQAWVSIQYANQAYTAGASEVVLEPANKAIFGGQSFISEIYTTQPIKFICDWMTCRNGGPLGNVLLSAADSALGGSGIFSSTETTSEGGSGILDEDQYTTGGEDTQDIRVGSGGAITGIARAYDAACRMDFEGAGAYLGTNEQNDDLQPQGGDGGVPAPEIGEVTSEDLDGEN